MSHYMQNRSVLWFATYLILLIWQASNQQLIECRSRAGEPKLVSQVQRPIQAGSSNLWSNVGGLIKYGIAPPDSYLGLLGRYHDWFRKYKALQSASDKAMRPPSEVVEEEYARADKQLMQESCHKENRELAPEELVNIDFVFRTLLRVIDQLEMRLVEDCESGDPSQCFPADEKQKLLDDATSRKLIERSRLAVVNSAKEFVENEMTIIGKVMSFDRIAQAVAKFSASPSDAIGFVGPIVQLLGNANAPILMEYLRDRQLRGAFRMINRLNPLNAVSCAFNRGIVNEDPNLEGDGAHSNVADS